MAFFFLIIYAVSLFIRPHEWAIVGMEELPLIRYTLLACVALFVIKQRKNLDAPHLKFIFMVFVAILLSTLFSGWVGGMFIFGEEFARQSLIPFILLSAFLDTRRKQYFMFSIIILTSIIMVWNGYTQTVNEEGIGWVGNKAYQNQELLRINYVGFFNDPNDLGMFLVMSIPIVLLMKERAPAFLKLPLWLTVGALLYGIYLTNSRGTLLATIAVTGLWFWREFGTKKTVWAGIAALPVLFVVLTKFRAISADEESAEGRLEAWYEGYQMLMSNPVFGVGYSQFLDYHVRTAHNSFVLAFSEMGLFGCFAWTALMTTTILLLYRISQRRFMPAGMDVNDARYIAGTEEARIATAFLYAFAAFLVSSLFLSRTYVPFLYFFIGMAAASFGRVRALFPEINQLFNYRELMILSGAVTAGGIIAFYLLLKFTL